jgi:hypothetical protein
MVSKPKWDKRILELSAKMKNSKTTQTSVLRWAGGVLAFLLLLGFPTAFPMTASNLVSSIT